MRKAVVILAVLAGLVVLFLQTARQTVSEPYTVRGDLLRDWTVTLEGPRDPLGAFLSLRPPPELPMQLSQQIFRRHTESMMAPAVRSVPLVLRTEFDLALSGVISADELVAMAGDRRVATGLEPVCLAVHRREGSRDPGRIFSVHFDGPAFAAFRQEIAGELVARGHPHAIFDPSALSPLLVVAASERTFDAWLPRRADAEDCLAPLVIE